MAVSTRFGETNNIVVGDDRENPVRLTSHDWHGESVPWNQRQVKAGLVANGTWAIDVVKAGKYEITLARWPIELGVPINSKVADGKAIVATKARLLAGPGELTKSIPDDAVSVKFEVELVAGKQRLQTWLIDDSGEKAVERGAYFVYLKRL